MLETISVPMASARRDIILVPFGSPRLRLSRYTPVNVTRKPDRRERVFVTSVVLKPLKRMKDAQSVAVVNVT